MRVPEISGVAMPKKKTQPGFAICGQCAEAIDLKALNLAIAEDRPYVHHCGRVLHWGGNESEVPTSNWDEADDMCPNCVTPWKCNGPHIASEPTGDA